MNNDGCQPIESDQGHLKTNLNFQHSWAKTQEKMDIHSINVYI